MLLALRPVSIGTTALPGIGPSRRRPNPAWDDGWSPALWLLSTRRSLAPGADTAA
jgi:hypothetical protein